MRERILRVATELIAERGISGTSLDRIASGVGIRKPSLLYHFPSKAALHRAVIDELLARWRDVIPRLLKTGATGWERFDAVLNEVEAFFSSDPSRARVLLRELIDPFEGNASRFDHYLAPWVSLTAAYVQRGKDEGTMRGDVDPEAYVLLMVQTIVANFAVAGAIGGPLDNNGYRQRLKRELRRIAQTALFRSTPEDTSGEPDNG